MIELDNIILGIIFIYYYMIKIFLNLSLLEFLLVFSFLELINIWGNLFILKCIIF